MKANQLAVRVVSLEADAGQGFENTDKDSFAIPFLRILQGLSPQCNKANTAEYIKGADQGDLFNTVSKEVVSSDDGMDIIICHYDRKFTEWAPNRGGFRGEHAPTDPILRKVEERVDDEGKRQMVLPNGNSVQDTRYHFALKLNEDGSTTRLLICAASSGIKKSKRLMTELDGLKSINSQGKPFTPPLFYSIIHVTTAPESNDQGDWFNWDFTIMRQLDLGDEDDVSLYLSAKAFRDSIAKGAVKVVHDLDETEDQEQF